MATLDYLNMLTAEQMKQMQAVSSKAMVQQQRSPASVYSTPEPVKTPSAFTTGMETLSTGVNKVFETWGDLPGIKQTKQALGAVVGGAGFFTGSVVGALGQTAVESYKGLTGKGFSVKNIVDVSTTTARETASGGYMMGSEGLVNATTAGLGKGLQLVIAVPMVYQGQKNLKEGWQSGNYEQFGEGLIQTIPLAIGIYTSRGRILGDVKAGFTPKEVGGKVGILEGSIATAKNLSKGITKDLILSPGFKDVIKREYRYARYGQNAPVITSRDIRLLNSAIKPAKAKGQSGRWNSDLEVVMSEVSDKPISSIVELDKAIKDRKAEVWSDVENALKEGDKEQIKIDGDAIAQAIRERKNNPKLQLENTKYVRNAETGEMLLKETGPLKRLEDLATAYEGKNIDFLDAETILETINAETQMYYKKNMTSRSVAERADPILASKLDIARVIREQQDLLLEGIELNGFANLKKTYGALSSVGEEVQNRMFNDNKLQISSLAQKVASGRQAMTVMAGLATGNPAIALGGLADKVLTDYVKSLDEASSKINRAMESIKKNKELNKGKTLQELINPPKSVSPDNSSLPKVNSDQPKNNIDHTLKSIPKSTEKSIVPAKKPSKTTFSGTTLEEFDNEITKRVDAFRQESGMMAVREGAGVTLRKVENAVGDINFVAKDFSLNKAKAGMKRQADNFKKEASTLLYDNDPEFRALVDGKDKLLEKQIDRAADSLSIEELFDGLSNEIKILQKDIYGSNTKLFDTKIGSTSNSEIKGFKKDSEITQFINHRARPDGLDVSGTATLYIGKKSDTFSVDGQHYYALWDKQPRQILQGKASLNIMGLKGDKEYLGSVLEFPELFEAYPSFKKDITLEIVGGDGGSMDFNPKTRKGTLTLGVDELYRDGKGLDTALHEIQHAIQGVEGWRRGGNPELFFKKPEYQHAIIQAQLDHVGELIRKGEGRISVGDYQKILEALKKTDDGKILSRSEMEDFIDITRDEAYLWYRRIPGEIEAHDAGFSIGKKRERPYSEKTPGDLPGYLDIKEADSGIVANQSPK